VLTETLVRRPANSKVKPKAKTIGQAVDAGTSISTGAGALWSSSSAGSKRSSAALHRDLTAAFNQLKT